MRWTLLLLILASFLAGCSGSDSDGNDDDADNGVDLPDDGDNQTVPAEPMEHAVELANNAFSPREITINVGDTVVWTHNDGTTPHNVESSDPQFDSHPDCTAAVPVVLDCMQDGDTFEYTFTEAGTVNYLCQVHAGMTGTITVVEGNATT